MIMSDRGTEFTSEVIAALTKLYKIRHVFASPYHPQSNAALERTHSTLKDYLKHFIRQNTHTWDIYICHAVFYFNTTIHSSTKHTPYELLFGFKPYIPSSITKERTLRYNYDDYLSNLQQKLYETHQIARKQLIQSKEASQKRYNSRTHVKTFYPNQLVLLKNKVIKPGISKKLQPQFLGPYRVVSVNPNNHTAKIEIKRRKITYHFDMLKPFSQPPSEDDSDDLANETPTSRRHSRNQSPIPNDQPSTSQQYLRNQPSTSQQH